AVGVQVVRAAGVVRRVDATGHGVAGGIFARRTLRTGPRGSGNAALGTRAALAGIASLDAVTAVLVSTLGRLGDVAAALPRLRAHVQRARKGIRVTHDRDPGLAKPVGPAGLRTVAKLAIVAFGRRGARIAVAVAVAISVAISVTIAISVAI